jgi:hypothetical protein
MPTIVFRGLLKCIEEGAWEGMPDAPCLPPPNHAAFNDALRALLWE